MNTDKGGVLKHTYFNPACCLKAFVLLLTFASCSCTFAQITIHGTLVDSITQKPIAFANLTLDDGKTGTSTEIEGNFVLVLPAGYAGVVHITHVSYQTRTVTIAFLQTHSAVLLNPGSTLLMEVAVTGQKEENPAFAIIRGAVAHRDEHDPDKLKSYQYVSYNKFLVTVSVPNAHTDSLLKKLHVQSDTVKLKKKQKRILYFDSLAQKTHFFLSESVTEKQKINPDREKERLLALKVSGYKSPLFTNVATDYQPFSFYTDNVSLLGKDFVNPVSRGTFSRYDFQLVDTTFHNQDTVYIIRYQPKKGKFFNGLKGVISISNDHYAIKNVIASSADTVMLTGIRIQQNYEKIQGHWFPVQLNTDMDFYQYGIYGRYMMVQHRSFLKEIQINPPLRRSSFGDVKVELTLPKPEDNLATLNKYRNGQLDAKEVHTYKFVDSLMRKFTFLDKGVEALVTQTLPLGPFELDLARIARFNRYENARLGAGLYTSNRFSKWLRLGGWAGYGFRDQQWKYGGEVRFNFSLDKDFFVRFSYAKDIYETGSSHINREGQIPGTENFRIWISSQYDRIEYYKGEIGYRIMPDVHATVFASRNDIEPTYNYSLQLGNDLLNRFIIAETGVTLRYVHDENYMSLRGKKVFIGQRFPVFTLSYTQAAPLWDAQNFNYSRLDFTGKIQIKHRYGGKSNFFLTSGWVNGIAPYGKLYNGRGSRSTNQFVDNYFQTMGLYEFTASQYASVFLSHNFGNILINKSFTKPELVLYHNMGIGRLDNASAHQGLALQSFDKGYTESGIGLNNIFRSKYVNVAYWGIGGAVFYRYGAYALPNPTDNLAWKITFTLGF